MRTKDDGNSNPFARSILTAFSVAAFSLRRFSPALPSTSTAALTALAPQQNVPQQNVRAIRLLPFHHCATFRHG